MYVYNAKQIAEIFSPETARDVLAPKHVTITFRYTDWWYWESNHALGIAAFCPGEFPLDGNQHSIWKDAEETIVWPNSVETVQIEFETREGKKKELETALDKIFKFKDWFRFKRADGKWYAVKETRVQDAQEWKWDGPTIFSDGKRYRHHPEGETMGYVVKVLHWGMEQGEGS